MYTSLMIDGVVNWGRSLPRWLTWPIITGLFLRIAGLSFVVGYGGAHLLIYGDGNGYLELARNLHNGFGFSSLWEGQLIPEVFRTPGLPILLAPFSGSLSGVIFYLFLITTLSGILLPLLVWVIGRKIFGNRNGIIAGAFTALEPNLIFYSWFPLTEIPFLLFMLGGLVALIFSRERRSLLLAVFSGTLFGYAVLIRPGTLAIFIIVLVACFFWELRKKTGLWRNSLVSLFFILVLLTPWVSRNHYISGSYSLAGVGWRNVYTDYLASVRALENKTAFWDEKKKLKDDADSLFGLSRVELNDPKNAAALREYSVNELLQHKGTVVKLETSLLFSFFTNDSYYSVLGRLKMIPYVYGRSSPTYMLLTEKFAAIPKIFKEMSRQYFIPVVGRIFTIGILVLAVVGFFRSRSPFKYVLALSIILLAVSATAIGLGVEARLRLPVQPFLFLLAAAAFMERPKKYEA